MYHIFPFNLIEKGSDIVLYGAGIAGRNFLLQIRNLNYCNVVCMADKNYRDKKIHDMSVIPPDKLPEYVYDKIVITQIKESVQREIKANLMELGIPEEKIVSFISNEIEWDRPQTGFTSQHEEYLWAQKVGDYLKKINPRLLVTSSRIDIVVRYLLFRDFINEIENKSHLSLFSRFTLCRTAGKEAASFYSGDGKQSIEEFIENGKRLCNSICTNGFEAEHFIPLGYDGRAYDGLHRIAAAIAANEEIWVRNYNDRPALSVTWQWFEEQGFLFEDRIRVLRGFTDIYPGNCGVFVLFATEENLWEYVEGQITQWFTLVGKLDFDYTDNYYAFNNTLRQIYSDLDRFSEWLTRKMNLLSLAPLKYRILVVSDENQEYEDFYASIRAMKLDLRQRMFVDIDHRVPILIHASDTKEEFNHLKQIFLSANNVYWQDKRLKQYYDIEFLNKLEEAKAWCKHNNIEPEDVCVVGSAVLELFGLRKSKNLNIIIKKRYGYKEKLQIGRLEIMGFDYGLNEHNITINNDILIEDDEYHMIFADLKFCNMEFVYRYKKIRGQEKDRLDIAKMDSWYSFVRNFDNKKALDQRVRVEMRKRGLFD